MILNRYVTIFLLAALVLGCKAKDKPAAPAPVQAPHRPASIAHKLYPIFENNRWGFVDEHGDLAVEPKFDFADQMTEGMSRVKLGDKWGYVDVSGAVVIEPAYERARRFANGLGAVRVDRKFGYVDKTGKMVVEPKYSKLAQSFSEGLAAVPDSNKLFGFINERGETVIPHKFTNAHEFSEGLAAVADGDKWGFIDTTGKWVFKPQFVWGDAFVDGHSLVRVGTQPDVDYALIDRKGRIKFQINTLHAKTPQDGLILVQQGDKWGHVDYEGNIVIPATYVAAFSFSEGLAAVRIGNGWGYIDKSNKLVLNVEFNVAEEFRDGVARVTWPGGLWGYVDQTGRVLWKSKVPGSPSSGDDFDS